MNIICEIGSNWKTFEDCLDSIKAAKASGADAVKFQMFTGKELTGNEGTILHELPREWIKELSLFARDLGIEFMCTAFSSEGYQFIDHFVIRHKIASAELTDINILKTVNTLGKPVVLSTAGSNMVDEVRHALLWLKSVPVTIMHCVGDYPARVIDFRHLGQLKEYFGQGYTYGYSDHSVDVLNIPKLAKDHGAWILEKHVNFTSHTDTPDAPHSLSGKEFSLMIKHLKGESTPDETADLSSRDMKAKWKRRFVATEMISAGDKLVIGKNVSIFRPMEASHLPVSPFRYFDLTDAVAVKKIHRGKTIEYTDIELKNR